MSALQEQAAAFLSLAKRQRVWSHQYLGWAREAEAEGDLRAFKIHSREAARLRDDARFHLGMARRRVNQMKGLQHA